MKVAKTRASDAKALSLPRDMPRATRKIKSTDEVVKFSLLLDAELARELDRIAEEMKAPDPSGARCRKATRRGRADQAPRAGVRQARTLHPLLPTIGAERISAREGRARSRRARDQPPRRGVTTHRVAA